MQNFAPRWGGSSSLDAQWPGGEERTVLLVLSFTPCTVAWKIFNTTTLHNDQSQSQSQSDRSPSLITLCTEDSHQEHQSMSCRDGSPLWVRHSAGTPCWGLEARQSSCFNIKLHILSLLYGRLYIKHMNRDFSCLISCICSFSCDVSMSWRKDQSNTGDNDRSSCNSEAYCTKPHSANKYNSDQPDLLFSPLMFSVYRYSSYNDHEISL